LTNKKKGGALILLRALRGWGVGGFFSKNLHASLFNDDLSNEPNFGQIYLATGRECVTG
jgi:hypothetical protein